MGSVGLGLGVVYGGVEVVWGSLGCRFKIAGNNFYGFPNVFGELSKNDKSIKSYSNTINISSTDHVKRFPDLIRLMKRKFRK